MVVPPVQAIPPPATARWMRSAASMSADGHAEPPRTSGAGYLVVGSILVGAILAQSLALLNAGQNEEDPKAR